MAPDPSSRNERKWQMVGVDLGHVSYHVTIQYKRTGSHFSLAGPLLAEKVVAGCLTPSLGYARETLV
jgi:hypothetical protein